MSDLGHTKRSEELKLTYNTIALLVAISGTLTPKDLRVRKAVPYAIDFSDDDEADHLRLHGCWSLYSIQMV